MQSLKITILSADTIEFLIDELDDMLKHCDLSDSQCDEIADLLDGLQDCDEIRLQLTT